MPAPPCALAAVAIRCQHCGTATRSFRSLAWAWNTATNRAGPMAGVVRRLNLLEVVADAGSGYRENVSVGVEMAACFDPAVHPMLELTGPARPIVTRGQRRHAYDLGYHASWFEQVVRTARGRGPAGIVGLFFPPARRYDLAVTAHGTRAGGQTGWGRAAFVINVYPDDKFKLSIRLPSVVTREGARGAGTVGETEYRTRSQGSQVGSARDTRAVTVTRDGDRTVRQIDETSANRTDTVSQTRVRSGAAGSNTITSSAGTDPAYLRAMRTISLTRDSGDISQSFEIVRFIETVGKIRSTILGLLDFLQNMARSVPRIGWSIGWSIDLFSGSLELEWGWKENPNNNLAWKWIKAGVRLKLVEATVTAEFGATVLRAEAKIAVSIGVALSIAANVESTPQNHAAFQLSGRAVTTGEVSVVAGWTESLRIEGRISTGVTMNTVMRFNPTFGWTLDAKLNEGKGSVVAHFFGWQRDRSWTFWNERVLMAPRSII